MERIAEFVERDDAVAFVTLKGREAYCVVGGINLPFAVAQRRVRAIYRGRDEPPDFVDDGYENDFDLEDSND